MILQLYKKYNVLTDISKGIQNSIKQLHITSQSCKILGAVFFVDTKNDEEYFTVRELISNELRNANFNFPFNVQSQSFDGDMSVEIWYDNTCTDVEYKTVENIQYTKTTTDEAVQIYAFGVSAMKKTESLIDQVEFSFSAVKKILDNENLEFSDIIRQWNYVPKILKKTQIDGKSFQNYQILNEIREKYYSMNSFSNGYPSATGIGTGFGNFCIDFIAINNNEAIKVKRLSNPNQDDAHAYNQNHLVGNAINGTYKKPPLFERAKIVNTKNSNILFISGTASIIGQETVGKGDIVQQTLTTISNIDKLIKMSENKFSIADITYLRAYVKSLADIDTVKAICDKKYQNVEVAYLQAEVCREDLLVELECEVVFN